MGISLLLVASCAGRDANPVAAYHPNDDNKTCEQLRAEIETDSSTARRLVVEEQDTRDGNVAAGVVGAVLFAPALLLMDFEDAAGTEREALNRRNTQLATMATNKCSEVVTYTPILEDPSTRRQQQDGPAYP